ncbi:hypothetical protein V8C44DRAFT_133104 [Trichoderma aethiopicum]
MDTPLEDDEAAMAQAMGFSSFGAHHRPQKRKYNPHADAVTSSDSATAQRAAAKPSATGSNSTPLGVAARKKPDPAAAANADEIDLDDDEDQDKDQEANLDNGENALEESTGVPEEPDQRSAPALVRPPGLPSRPPPGVGAAGSSSGGHHRVNQRREDDDSWSEGYYDPQSNENPWRRLEESLGLQPLGTWLAPGHRASARS